jgi:hypothetical protein
MSESGTFLPCRPRRAMSVIGGRPADICSMRVLRILDPDRKSGRRFCYDAQRVAATLTPQFVDFARNIRVK